MALIDPLKDKRVIVLGFARQGQALARWLPKIGAKTVVSDMRSAEAMGLDFAQYPDVTFVLGEHPEALLEDANLLCLSGGVSLDLPIVQAAVERGIPLSNDAQLFLERCTAPVIGITGSAGKTTTTSLMGAVSRAAGYTTWVGGNIGDVLLDDLDTIRSDHRVVMELSSFQLELMNISPPLATVLNITPNHLDRHGTMENYMRAKANILLHQKQDAVAVLCNDDAGSRALALAVRGMLLHYSMVEMVSDGAFMVGQRLLVGGTASSTGSPQVVLGRDEIPLRGDHNVLNVLAVCALAGAQGIAPDVIAEAIRTFTPVPHRLEPVRVLNGVTYINDSIATAPERVVAALRSFKEPLILLVGGKDKNLPWGEMLLLALQKTRQIIAFGAAAELVVETTKKLTGRDDLIMRVNTLDEAVAGAVKIAQPGDVVLLSPGGTSYDAYVDFAARGEHFRQLVMGL